MSTMTLPRSERSLQNAGHGLRAFVAFLAVIFLGTNACRAAGGGVLDNGGFFSEQAKSDATKAIVDAERTLHKGVLIETFREIPADVKAGVDVNDKAALSHLYEQWAIKQAKQHTVNGVYLLLVKEPAHLQPYIGGDTQRLAFTVKDRDMLVPMMLLKLRAHQNDDALRDGVNFVVATMKSHTNPRAHANSAPVVSRPAQSSGGSSGWIIQALVIGVVVWVVIGIIRALSGRMSGGAAAGQPGMGGGGGGFFSSLVGGMFGAAAGMWMYDQFFSSHGSNSAYGADQNAGDSGFTGQDNDNDSGASGGGGDFGGDSGGGDSGGGEDFGGGGDF